MRSHHTGVANRRLAVVRAVVLLSFAALAARAAHLSVVDDRGATRGRAQTIRVVTLAPERGAIFDRNEDELALNVDAPSVYAIPAARDDWKSTSRRLSPLLGVPAARLEERLRDRRAFGFLARWVSSETADRVRALNLPGIGVLDEPRRRYPHSELAAGVLGFTNIDGKGVRGIEQLENRWMRGEPRRIPVERDASGRLLLRNSDVSFETSGGDVALTLDARLQADAEAALASTIRRTGARGGVVISMNPRNGDILALAEAPNFDPNRFFEVDFASTRSRAFLDAAEPGSTFKAFLVAAALDAGAITKDEIIDCESGSFRIPGKTIRDHDPHGALSASDILRVSSNVGAVKIAFALGRRAHYDALRRFGFGAPTASRFPDESAGLLRSWEHWKRVDHATIAYGQGVNVTPVQLASAFSALANGGLVAKPRLVLARRAPGGSWKTTPQQPMDRVVSAETAATVMEMLEGVVTHSGTAPQAGLRGMRVAGKTGTAQKWDAQKGRYAANRFTAWFMGALPARNPVLVIVAALDEPQRPDHTGGASAAPLFAEVASAHLLRFGIDTIPQQPAPLSESPTLLAKAEDPKREAAGVVAPRTETGPERGAPTATALPEFHKLGDRLLMPDLTGLSIEQVREITAETFQVVEVFGSGWAVSQEPPPGTVVYGHEPVLRVRFSPAPEAEG